MKRCLWLVSIFVLMAVRSVIAQTPDTIDHNGPIITMNDAQTTAEAVAPEFSRIHEEIPLGQRRGRVFRLKVLPGPDRRLSLTYVSRRISEIRQAANVRVSERGKVKFASAHDLRRSFGDRWATRVMPPILQQLMRHDTIETTLRFYVGMDAVRSSGLLWQTVHGKSDSLSDTTAFSAQLAAHENAGSPIPLETSGEGAARIRTGE